VDARERLFHSVVREYIVSTWHFCVNLSKTFKIAGLYMWLVLFLANGSLTHCEIGNPNSVNSCLNYIQLTTIFSLNISVMNLLCYVVP